jgi:phosphatidylglycerol---prolipoprotein diacylglyceryl transferase
MRPRLVEALYAALRTSAFQWIIPGAAIMFAAAMLASLWVFVRRCGKAGLSRYHAVGAGLWAMAGGLIGTRAFYLLQHWQFTLADPMQVFDVKGGIASWGAYLGGFIGFVAYCWLRRVPLLPYADAVAPCLGLGVAIARWGCFLNGDDFGTLSGLPWAVRFPHGSIPFVAQVQRGLLSPLEDLSFPVHPVQIYLSLTGLVLFIVTSAFWKRFSQRTGATFCVYWVGYCVSRFLWEFLRGDQTQRLASLTVPQVMALVLVGPLLVGLWWSFRPVCCQRAIT